MKKSGTPQRRGLATAQATPQAAQLAALRRLLDSGDVDAAQRRLSELLRAYPHFKPLRALAWELACEISHPAVIAARAWDWHKASPNSTAALQALVDAARDAGLIALAAQAAIELGRLRPGVTQIERPAPLLDSRGELNFEEGLAIDLSRMHLADGQPRRAAEALRGCQHLSARNNLALALFACGEVLSARDLAEQLWQEGKGNLFALELALRLRCWTDGQSSLARWREPLLATTPRRAEDATAQVTALLFIGAADAARLAWRKADGQDYWESASGQLRKVWRELGDDDPDLGESGMLWLPSTWIDRLRSASTRAGLPAQAGSLQAALLDCRAHPDYLRRICELSSDSAGLLALEVLKHRAEHSLAAGQADPAAVGALTELLVSLRGSDDDRASLLEWMTRQRLRSSSEPARLRAGGDIREVRSVELRIHAEVQPSRFRDDAAAAIVDQLVEAGRAQDFRRASTLAQDLCDSHPLEAAAWTYLAQARMSLDPADPDAPGLMRKAFELDPQYLFARCGWARCLIQQGRLEQARELIRHLHLRPDWHFSEYRSFLLTQLDLATADGEMRSQATLVKSLQDLEAEFG